MVTSFASHISRKHRFWSNRHLNDECFQQQVNHAALTGMQIEENDPISHENLEIEEGSHSDGDDDCLSDNQVEELFMKELALFYLKLQTKHVIFFWCYWDVSPAPYWCFCISFKIHITILLVLVTLPFSLLFISE